MKSSKMIDAPKQLLDTGLEVFLEKGYSATGINELLAKAGVPRGSFYHYFKSKEAFGLNIVDLYADQVTQMLVRNLGNSKLPPLARIKALMDESSEGMAKSEFRKGCLIGNLGHEIEALPESFREKLMQVLSGWESSLEACLVEARDRGDIPESTDCSRVAELFWVGWEGAVFRSKLEQSCRPLELFADYFFVAVGGKPSC